VPHLLLVDDDPEALEWLTELAKGEGFTVSQADSLRAARIHMSRLQPDVLLSDLHLPDGLCIELVIALESKETS
jgi:DNA-binding response OmpR family regulator